MERESSIELHASACTTVVGYLVSGICRIIYALFYGLFRGLCLLPLFRGFRNAIVEEVELAKKKAKTTTKKS